MVVDEETYRLHRIIIYTFNFFCQFFGVFGNINLIVLTYRKTALQSKYGLILAFLALLHTLCIFYEYIDMGFGVAILFYQYQMHRRLCFYSTFPYVFLHCLQTGTICVLAFDLFVAIAFPIKHRVINVRYYLPTVFFFPVCYGTAIVTAGFIYMDDAAIQMCNPPSALPPSVNSDWYAFMLVFTVITVVLYFLAFGLLYWKMKYCSNHMEMVERKAMKTLQMLIVVFVISRFITTILINILTLFGANPDFRTLVQNYNGIFAVITFSQNAYVCLIRSAEYRSLFKEQFAIILRKCGSPCLNNWTQLQVNSGAAKSNTLHSKVVHPPQFRSRVATIP